ncbi:hypothetical protein, partial [Streptococcus dysgalactiae]|uniref:hypothetical protein n=1 Tax=Streptococcus dysgalactiae TaxID=1334 RepID=UPI001E57FA25
NRILKPIYGILLVLRGQRSLLLDISIQKHPLIFPLNIIATPSVAIFLSLINKKQPQRAEKIDF